VPGPELNLGGSPHDSDDIQDLWYALEELGFSVGYIGQTDYDFHNDATLPANDESVGSVRAPGGDRLIGQAVSTGQWSLAVRWLDGDDNIVREEGISSNHEADRWANFSLDSKSPFADIVVYDQSGSEQTVSMTVHYR
jgi:hypothetical protein